MNVPLLLVICAAAQGSPQSHRLEVLRNLDTPARYSIHVLHAYWQELRQELSPELDEASRRLQDLLQEPPVSLDVHAVIEVLGRAQEAARCSTEVRWLEHTKTVIQDNGTVVTYGSPHDNRSRDYFINHTDLFQLSYANGQLDWYDPHSRPFLFYTWTTVVSPLPIGEAVMSANLIDTEYPDTYEVQGLSSRKWIRYSSELPVACLSRDHMGGGFWCAIEYGCTDGASGQLAPSRVCRASWTDHSCSIWLFELSELEFGLAVPIKLSVREKVQLIEQRHTGQVKRLGADISRWPPRVLQYLALEAP